MTPFGTFQYKVLCFGLTNAPATFQKVINTVLIDAYCVVNLDDILIFSKDPTSHLEHMRAVLESRKGAC